MWTISPQYHVVDSITKLTKIAREGRFPITDSDTQYSFTNTLTTLKLKDSTHRPPTEIDVCILSRLQTPGPSTRTAVSPKAQTVPTPRAGRKSMEHPGRRHTRAHTQ
ncbi:hypothetical protein CGCS363_v001825 [Colletotrichum siamense]|uniref:uncharacterized protein n=1 Tax=Colletotrichum siamense TaxID=690259 RepID=UPI001872739D|nr:uncharacterized protein CGCS363_v001825 [Colletotrichum siamense]KAF5516536.1 hypothetical protein CGCS363_v001825 [Colletotrichum siamense]